MSDFPSQQQDKFVLRLPDGMRDKIKAAAESANRSMNAEIVLRLTESLRDHTVISDNPLENEQRELERHLQAARVEHEMTAMRLLLLNSKLAELNQKQVELNQKQTEGSDSANKQAGTQTLRPGP